MTKGRKDSILSEGIHEGFEWKVLHNWMGHRCGYIYIPSNHPWFKKHYDNIDCDCHGGLTYSQTDDLIPEKWCIGFDCAHYCDAQDPSLPSECRLYMTGIVRTQEYVEAQCRYLCEQAKAVCQIKST
jgi:hypothetical protein